MPCYFPSYGLLEYLSEQCSCRTLPSVQGTLTRQLFQSDQLWQLFQSDLFWYCWFLGYSTWQSRGYIARRDMQEVILKYTSWCISSRHTPDHELYLPLWSLFREIFLIYRFGCIFPFSSFLKFKLLVSYSSALPVSPLYLYAKIIAWHKNKHSKDSTPYWLIGIIAEWQAEVFLSLGTEAAEVINCIAFYPI